MVDQANSQDYPIATKHYPPRIARDNTTRASFYDDIGLVEVQGTIQFTLYIRPLCLPFTDEMPKTVTVMGWGITRNFGDSSEILLKTDVQYFTMAQCNEQFPKTLRKVRNSVSEKTQICYGTPKRPVDSDSLIPDAVSDACSVSI